MNRVVVSNIHKSYGNTDALRGVSFEVGDGEIFGIIGADGAGKTTIFRLLTTLLLPDAGSAQVDGLDCVAQYKEIRKQVGYMPGRFSLYQDLSVEENLRFFASLFGVTPEQNMDLIQDIYVQIEPFKMRRAGKLSGGMKQKLALCCALIHRPSVLFLDEPTTGVDAVSRREFWQMLNKLRSQGITILVSTPYMDEAVLCDRIALIDNGLFMTIDTPQNIMDHYDDTLYAVSGSKMNELLKLLRANSAVSSCYPFGESIHITLHKGRDLQLLTSDPALKEITINTIRPTIEDCFLKLIRHE